MTDSDNGPAGLYFGRKTHPLTPSRVREGELNSLIFFPFRKESGRTSDL